jgi:hypothetical protein
LPLALRGPGHDLVQSRAICKLTPDRFELEVGREPPPSSLLSDPALLGSPGSLANPPLSGAKSRVEIIRKYDGVTALPTPANAFTIRQEVETFA